MCFEETTPVGSPKILRRSLQEVFQLQGQDRSYNFTRSDAERQKIRTVQTRRYEGRRTLITRHNERRMLQTQARQRSVDSTFDGLYLGLPLKSPSERSLERSVDKNEWTRTKGLNKKYKQQVFTPKVIQYDAEALDKIIERQDKETAATRHKSQDLANKRQNLMRRMKRVQQRTKRLENASGVYKLRQNNRRAKSSLNEKISPRLRELSSPKQQYSNPRNPYTSSDFRGIIHWDHPQIIEESKGFISPVSCLRKQPMPAFVLSKANKEKSARAFSMSQEAIKLEEEINKFESRFEQEPKRQGYLRLSLDNFVKIDRKLVKDISFDDPDMFK